MNKRGKSRHYCAHGARFTSYGGDLPTRPLPEAGEGLLAIRYV
jgi:hypothetical protein